MNRVGKIRILPHERPVPEREHSEIPMDRDAHARTGGGYAPAGLAVKRRGQQIEAFFNCQGPEAAGDGTLQKPFSLPGRPLTSPPVLVALKRKMGTL